MYYVQLAQRVVHMHVVSISLWRRRSFAEYDGQGGGVRNDAKGTLVDAVTTTETTA